MSQARAIFLAACVSVITFWLGGSAVRADVLVCKDGRVLKGLVVLEDQRQVIFDYQKGAATARMVLPREQVEEIRIGEAAPATASVFLPATTTATSLPANADAFALMADLSAKVKAVLRPLPPMPRNLTRLQQEQLQAQQREEIREMRDKALALCRELNGREVVVWGNVEEAVTRERAYVVVLSRAFGKDAQGLKTPVALEESHDLFDRTLTPGEANAVAEALRSATPEGPGKRSLIQLVTSDRKANALARNTVMPPVFAIIRHTRLYFADGRELTRDWDGSSRPDQPLVVQCVAVAE